MNKLNADFVEKIKALHNASLIEIQNRLKEFSEIKGEQIFYELCYCLCTPQSKAENAFKVQKILEKQNYLYNEIDLLGTLFNKDNYIRFHNQKAKWIELAKSSFQDILAILNLKIDNSSKRILLKNLILGFGMKESSHFMRNIGYRGMGIMDRHIINCMIEAGALENEIKLGSEKKYLEIEKKFQIFAEYLEIDFDELDLTLWSLKAGKILK